MNDIAAIILAAGEGTRIRARRKNKVVYKLGGKPMICYAVETIRKTGIETVIVVVKFKAQSVTDALGDTVTYVTQGEKSGTAGALEAGLSAISSRISDVLVMCGDDSAFYTPELFNQLVQEHRTHAADVTLLSVTVVDPTGLGRIIRDAAGNIVSIVEEKLATELQKKIREINMGCYCFHVPFLKRRMLDISENPVSHEYYLTDIVSLALSHGERVHVVHSDDKSVWFGVNTRGQWLKAQRLMAKRKLG